MARKAEIVSANDWLRKAGGKELSKARFCRSGMRWTRTSGAPILQLRAITLSQHWDSFWSKVMRYAAEKLHQGEIAPR